jgi:hypothetical protein
MIVELKAVQKKLFSALLSIRYNKNDQNFTINQFIPNKSMLLKELLIN